MRRLFVPTALLLIGSIVACGERSPVDPGGPTAGRPGNLDARYEWALDGWAGTQPVGQPTVVVTWSPPTSWRDEPFRVYARRSTDNDYFLVATVTSCAGSVCRYVDANLVSGRSYDYYVAVVDERSGQETPTQSAVAVDVPAYTAPPRASAPWVIGLDNAVYLEWEDVPLGDRFWKYVVFQERRDADSVFFQIGETDGYGFLDVLAQNGVSYQYSIAAVDIDGHIGQRSPLSLAGIPRPDAKGELVYAFSDSAQVSGFQFDAEARTGRIVAGNAAQAHWRLEASGDEWRIAPLNGTAVLDAGFTTELTCGPASDPGCISIDEAPQSGYSTDPLPLAQENTYVLRMGTGSQARYAKVRVQILGYGASSDRRLMIFDWAFQTRAGETSLNLLGAERSE